MCVDLPDRVRSNSRLPFSRRVLYFYGSTLTPIEAGRGLVLEIGYIIHERGQNLSRNKVKLYIGLYFYRF